MPEIGRHPPAFGTRFADDGCTQMRNRSTMAGRRTLFSGLSRDSFLLALASLFADIATEMLYPVLPVFLTQTLKAGGSVMGLVEGLPKVRRISCRAFRGRFRTA